MMGYDMDLITLLLAALATARLTRLITRDVIFSGPRNRFIVAMPAKLEQVAYLLTCTWCASVWAGAGVAGAWYLWGGTRAFTAVVGALAFSHFTGWLAAQEER
jgi:hypothetical protein